MNLTLSHPVQLAAIGCILASQSHAQCTIQDLTGSSASVGDRFGSDVALDGGLAIVGAENDDTLGANSGAAYVYDLASGLAVEEAKLLASDGTASDHFGLDVAIDGDVAIVGAPGLYTGVSGPGAAYVFRRIGGTWIEEQILVPSGSENDDNFGYSIALDGGRALIGAPHWGNGDAAVYVFELVGSSWTEVQELIPGDIGFGDAFGEELALDGDRILISSPFDNLGGLSSAGSVYVYEETGGLWSQAAKFTAVVPEDDPLLLGPVLLQPDPQRCPDSLHGRRIQRRLAGLASQAIGPEYRGDERGLLHPTSSSRPSSSPGRWR